MTPPPPTQPKELLYGQAETSYVLRMIRHRLPDSAALLEPAVQAFTGAILADGVDWTLAWETLISARCPR